MSETTVTIVTNPDIYNGSDYAITSIGFNKNENDTIISTLEHIPYNITLNLQDVNSSIDLIWLTSAVKSSDIVILNLNNDCNQILYGWILSQPTCYFVMDSTQYDIISTRRVENFLQPIENIFKPLED